MRGSRSFARPSRKSPAMSDTSHPAMLSEPEELQLAFMDDDDCAPVTVLIAVAFVVLLLAGGWMVRKAKVML